MKRAAVRRTPQIQAIDPRAARYALPQCFALVDQAGLVLVLATTQRRLTSAQKKHPNAEAFAVYALSLKKEG